MPVNTRNRRGAAIGFVLPLPGVWPLADAALTQPDRQQVTWAYPGILAGPLYTYVLIRAWADTLTHAHATGDALTVAHATGDELL